LDYDRLLKGVPCQGWLNLTLNDVKKGKGGIRDMYLQEEFRPAGSQVKDVLL